ncbi:hypothetical protein SAMN05216188_13347 [Lentzea xinjiangensis]|uniref:Uncharacterized protein n=1 Tax=Lentzea xinjiangensis TaxID=402600 RepID=A0A1H9WHC5_9PSEU|nr:hypothetical protein SAMN05216188_13347 [Lentzea xinjiangensis]
MTATAQSPTLRCERRYQCAEDEQRRELHDLGQQVAEVLEVFGCNSVQRRDGRARGERSEVGVACVRCQALKHGLEPQQVQHHQRPYACRKLHARRLSGMVVLSDDSAETVLSVNGETFNLAVFKRQGRARRGTSAASDRWARCSLECRSYSRSACHRWGQFQDQRAVQQLPWLLHKAEALLLLDASRLTHRFRDDRTQSTPAHPGQVTRPVPDVRTHVACVGLDGLRPGAGGSSSLAGSPRSTPPATSTGWSTPTGGPGGLAR